MKHNKIIILVMLLFSMHIMAQDSNIETMNSVKKSKSYIFAEMTDQSKERAVTAAYDMLETKIEAWVKEHSKKKVQQVVATDVHTLVDTIFLKRVNMVCAFVYVKKSNLIPVYSDKGIAIIDTDANNDDVVITKPSLSQQLTENAEPESTEKDKKDLNDNNKAEKDDNANSKVAETKDVKQKDAAESVAALAEIMAVKSFFDLKKVIEPLKQQGIVTDYGKYATMDDPQQSYLIVYDPAGNIRAILGKETEEESRLNLKTKQQDSVSNYRGCGAIWFKLK